jgi:hypothetical protein
MQVSSFDLAKMSSVLTVLFTMYEYGTVVKK